MEERAGQSSRTARLRGCPHHATIVAYLALFLALGGSAWALSRGEVKSKHIAQNAVKSKHLKNGQIKSADIRKAAVTAPKLACKGNSPGDVMVKAGSVCIDRYENSVWDAPTGGNQLTSEAQIDAVCPNNGQDCEGTIFARSVAGVEPARGITWFQAQQALANSRKRLPSNAEWQQAVSGTPDSTACNVDTGSVQSTGASPGCVSDHDASDMVGNVWEWTADWVSATTTCPGWGGFSDDRMCLSGAHTVEEGPGALVRGGYFDFGTNTGPFAILGLRPSIADTFVGFRGAR